MVSKVVKNAKFGAEPAPVKKARLPNEPDFVDGNPLAWRFSAWDRAGPFAWVIADADKFREIIEKLAELESKNWNEITAGGSHAIPVQDLCKDAKNRLVKIKRDDLDELISLRLTGPNRVWCIKTGHILRLLWWDENHQVYPTPVDKNDRKKEQRRRNT